MFDLSNDELLALSPDEVVERIQIEALEIVVKQAVKEWVELEYNRCLLCGTSITGLNGLSEYPVCEECRKE